MASRVVFVPQGAINIINVNVVHGDQYNQYANPGTTDSTTINLVFGHQFRSFAPNTDATVPTTVTLDTPTDANPQPDTRVITINIVGGNQYNHYGFQNDTRSTIVNVVYGHQVNY